MAADNSAASKAASDGYRRRLFAGVGDSYEEALRNAVGQANAGGFGSANPVAHRVVPKDADWNDTDWNDTNWHAVLVHGRN